MGRGRRTIPLDPIDVSTLADFYSPLSADDGHLSRPDMEGLSHTPPASPDEALVHRRETIARQARIIGQLERSDWERSNRDYRAIFDVDQVTVVGWYRNLGGTEQIRDRLGNHIWGDAIGLEQPLFSPLDLIGLGIGRAAARGIIHLGTRFAARFAARTAARGLGEVAGRRIAARVTDALRRSIQSTAVRRLIRRASTEELSSLARQAQGLVRRLQSEGRRIVVNIGGEFPVGWDRTALGEITEHAINLNPLIDRSAAEGIDNLVRGSADDIGSIFLRGQVDEIVSNRLQPFGVNWQNAIPGIHRVLRERGRVLIRFQGGSREEVETIVRLLNNHRFRDIERLGDAGVSAIRT